MLDVHLPRDEQEFYFWATLLIILYTVLTLAIRLARGRRDFEIPALVFDAATFSGSVLLLIGVTIDPQTLKLMGDTTWFLIIAGLVGVFYTAAAPFR
jgi:Trk-type K+ transport system membrane component